MIEVKNLSKNFKVYNKGDGLLGAVKALLSRKFIIKKAIDNVSFKINSGEIVGYIGANGAGKSTTIKIMTGVLRPTSGDCIVNGIRPYISRKENAKNIGVVFGQRTQLWWDLPLKETFSILKDIYEIEDIDYKERMAFLNNVLSLDEFINKPVRVLSLGQRMRADLAASLIHNPPILYLDEPTIGLDIVVKEKIINSIKQINEKFSTTIVLTTHDLSDISELCERIIIMDNGKKIFDGTIKEIKDIFGYNKVMEITLKNENEFESINLYKQLKINKKELEIDVKNNLVCLKFDKSAIDISEILNFISSEYEILDVNVKEIDIETIIKKIYTNGAIL